MTSPVGAMYMALEGAMSRRNETAIFINETQRRDLLQGLFVNYYRAVEADRTVFDTNRMWCAKLPALTQLFPQARTICCVRNVAWIIDSIERLVRKNAFELSGLFGFEPGNTVFTRVNRVASSDGLVGFALDALKEGFFGEQARRMVLVEYEALAKAPLSTLRHLYTVLEEPYFEHDLDNVDYAADEFDMALGAPGLHTIRRKVEWVERQTVLPPELFQRFEHDAFWRRPDVNIRQVPIIHLD
jgi:sulfotransferase